MADFLLPIDVARVVPSSEYGSRDGATPTRHVWHHGATTSGWAIEANMEPGGRELSANIVIHNDGTKVGKVPERFRAFTSGSYRIDREAITSEMANLAVEGWTISDATYDAAGEIAAAEYLAYGIPLDRDHHIGHNELYTAKWGWESYPTYCPGTPDRIDWIVELGRRKVSAGYSLAGLGTRPLPIRSEDDVIIYIATSASADGLIPKGFSFIQGTEGPLRPLSQLEYESYRFYSKNNVTGTVVPTRIAEWSGEQIRELVRGVGLREWDGMAGRNNPALTGNTVK